MKKQGEYDVTQDLVTLSTITGNMKEYISQFLFFEESTREVLETIHVTMEGKYKELKHTFEDSIDKLNSINMESGNEFRNSIEECVENGSNYFRTALSMLYKINTFDFGGFPDDYPQRVIQHIITEYNALQPSTSLITKIKSALPMQQPDKLNIASILENQMVQYILFDALTEAQNMYMQSLIHGEQIQNELYTDVLDTVYNYLTPEENKDKSVFAILTKVFEILVKSMMRFNKSLVKYNMDIINTAHNFTTRINLIPDIYHNNPEYSTMLARGKDEILYRIYLNLIPIIEIDNPVNELISLVGNIDFINTFLPPERQLTEEQEPKPEEQQTIEPQQKRKVNQYLLERYNMLIEASEDMLRDIKRLEERSIKLKHGSKEKDDTDTILIYRMEVYDKLLKDIIKIEKKLHPKAK